MRTILKLFPGFVALLAAIILTGCFGTSQRIPTRYYVLDYYASTENPKLVRREPSPRTLEIVGATISRTYSRNQIVVREHFSQVTYLPNDMWANRLDDAIPNLVMQRFRAYNIFRRVDRDLGEVTPDYYLETQINNIEMVGGEKPQAYLNLEYNLRNAKTQQVVLSHRNDQLKNLKDDSIIYLVQTLNDMLMYQTDLFAAKCIDFLIGRRPDDKVSAIAQKVPHRSTLQLLEPVEGEELSGELLINLITTTDFEMQYSVFCNEVDFSEFKETGQIGIPLKLPPGSYCAFLGDTEDVVVENIIIEPNRRTVLDPQWSELVIIIMDESHNRVRMNYDLYRRKPGDHYFSNFSQGFSIGEDDINEPDKVWILPEGNYMIRLQGGSWSDLRDFTTVRTIEGESQFLTIVVNPQGERTILIGAGVLGDALHARGMRRVHNGAIHFNLSIASNNSVDKDQPTRSFSLSGQFDNRIETNFHRLHYIGRSVYDVGMNLTTGSDFRIDVDDYTMRNTILFLPLEKYQYLKTLGFYARGDVTTHLFDETVFFGENKDLILYRVDGDSIIWNDQNRLRTKVALFPLTLREGTGLTYRFVFSPNASIGIRSGLGWKQEYHRRNYRYTGTQDNYDVYSEREDIITRGVESTLILSLMNLFKRITVNSTFDVLFPMESKDRNAKVENENRINIRLVRNVSIDLKANFKYDQAFKEYLIFDFSSFVRLSLFY